MLTRISAVLLCFAALGSAANAGVCQTEDLMPAFFAFEDSTKALPPEQRADRFVKDFAARYPAFYSPDFGGPEKLRQASLRLLDPAQPEQLGGFPPLTDEKLLAVNAAIGGAFADAQQKFLKTFVDFRCETGVAFGPSFMFFDGSGGRDANGSWQMRFGVDMVALLHGPDDMPAFFTHELFHIYHHDLLGDAIPKDEGVVWWQMWEEGLATYVSKRLTPGISEQQVFWFPTDLVEQMKAPGVMRSAARLMLADFDKSMSVSQPWFQMGRSAPGLPSRAGYYVGYRMAAALGRNHSLSWLAHLSPDTVKQQARAFLAAQAR
jgi:hypothetical protein